MQFESVFGLFLGLLSIAVTVYFSMRERQRSRGPLPMVLLESDVIVPATAQFARDIETRFRGQVVPRLTVSAITFWNQGALFVDSSMLVNSDPLRIELPAESSIFESSLFLRTREAIGADIGTSEDAPNRIDVTFDFLEANDAFVVAVVHSARPDDVTVRGSLKGFDGGFRRIEDVARQQTAPLEAMKRLPKGLKFTAAAGALATVLFSFAVAAGLWEQSVAVPMLSLGPLPVSPPTVGWLLFVLALPYLLLGLLYTLLRMPDPPARPLREFEVRD